MPSQMVEWQYSPRAVSRLGGVCTVAIAGGAVIVALRSATAHPGVVVSVSGLWLVVGIVQSVVAPVAAPSIARAIHLAATVSLLIGAWVGGPAMVTPLLAVLSADIVGWFTIFPRVRAWVGSAVTVTAAAALAVGAGLPAAHVVAAVGGCAAVVVTIDWAVSVAGTAEIDPLTDLPNRRQLLRAVDVIASAGSVAVVDVDDFKGINDTWGHGHGDQILRSVAQMLREAIGSDGSAYRTGGDEFVLLTDLAPAELDDRLAPVRSGMPGTWSASTGVDAHAGRSDVIEAIARADAALYLHKREARS